MTTVAGDAELARLNAEVNLHMVRLLKAGQEFRTSQSAESFEAFRAATAEYVAVHRRWFALACPGQNYDAVYGS
jgi:hypothetical protein